MKRVALAALCALGLLTVTASGADFTATSASSSSIGAAADFNTVAVDFSAPAATLAGTVALAATASSNRGIASVVFQASPAGTGDWTQVCSAPCAWNTTTIADGVYDLRVVATDTAGYARTASHANRTVDNVALTVTLNDPGAMSGTESLSASAANATGGIQALTIQHRAQGASSWTTLCSGAATPQSCSLNTTLLPDGPRELRATVRDNAGHETVSTMITRTVDNSPPQTTSSVPPTGSGTVTMTADAHDDGSGIKYVAFQVNYQGNWYEVCRDSTSPYSCSGDSTLAEDGTYSVRTATENNAGVIAYGSSQQITVDNPPRGTDVQAANGAPSTAATLSQGDWIRLTWNEPIAPASVLTGWTGASTAIRVFVDDNASNDQLRFVSVGGAPLNLVLGAADLKLGANYVAAASEFNATMSQSANSITITFGTQVAGTPAAAAAGTMAWRPSSGAKDAGGHASATTLVTESGGADVDF